MEDVVSTTLTLVAGLGTEVLLLAFQIFLRVLVVYACSRVENFHSKALACRLLDVCVCV